MCLAYAWTTGPLGPGAVAAYATTDALSVTGKIEVVAAFFAPGHKAN